MDEAEETLNEALRLVEPSRGEEETVRQIAEMILRRVEEAAAGAESVSSVELGGSFAKGTWLKGDVDIDVFVKFRPGLSKKRLEEVGVDIGRKALAGYDWFLRYSEHPYVEGVIDGVKINVVACYEVAEGLWQSAADRSPYHTRLILSRFDDRLRREVRLLKGFMKGVGLYGAEIRVEGFSGYVCEVLVLKYGGFQAVLRRASGFRDGEVVGFGETDAMASERFRSPLIILDPVDPMRNLGAAISPEKVAAFTLAARRFLGDPDVSFFRWNPPSDLSTRVAESQLLDHILAAVFRHEPRMVDILWGQLKRSERRLAAQLSKAGFNVLRSISVSDEKERSAFIFLLEGQRLPKLQARTGPRVEMAEEVETFLGRNRKRTKIIWVGHDQRTYALGERRYQLASDLLGALLGGEVRGSGVAPGLKKEISADFEVLSGRGVLEATSGRKWLTQGLWQVVSTDGFGFGSD
jgi:tRNA nucleotidyltransferase (CCA-adding enzyme)